MTLRIVFAGSPAAAVPSLQALIDGPHEVVAVVTREPSPQGRKRTLTATPVAEVATQAGLPLIETNRLGPVADDLIGLEPDLGVIVAYVKLSDLARLELGTALFAFVGLIVVMIAAEAALEPHEIWRRLGPQASARLLGRLGGRALISCHNCDQLVPMAPLPARARAHCPRCSAALHRRKPNSIARTWALVLTAAILYIPANVLPVIEP